MKILQKSLHEICNWSIEELPQLKENADGMIMLLKDLNERSVTHVLIRGWLLVIFYPTHWLVGGSLTMEYVMSKRETTYF